MGRPDRCVTEDPAFQDRLKVAEPRNTNRVGVGFGETAIRYQGQVGQALARAAFAEHAQDRQIGLFRIVRSARLRSLRTPILPRSAKGSKQPGTARLKTFSCCLQTVIIGTPFRHSPLLDFSRPGKQRDCAFAG